MWRTGRLIDILLTGRLADGILFMGDKMSMAHSLEVRMPFLDRSVIDFGIGAHFPTESIDQIGEVINRL